MIDLQFQCLDGGNAPSIMIGIPNMGEIKTPLMFRLLQWFSWRKYNLYLFAPMNQIPHDRARNIIHKRFITKTDCEYLFWIDSDVIPPYKAIDKLLDYDKDIVSLTVPMVHQGNIDISFEPQALDYHNKNGGYFTTHYGKGELEKVGVTTIGCTLIKRQVMIDVGKGAFDFQEKKAGDGWNIARWGEDLYFGMKYMKAGYQAWNDFGTVCEHYSEVNTSSVNYLIKKVLNQKYG